MKKKISLKSFFNKKENVALLVLGVLFCTGIVVSNFKDNNIPLHDGDVLVDSLNVATNEEKAADKGGNLEEKRANVDMERNKVISTLDATIEESKNESEKNSAIKEKETLVKYMKQEVEIENIIEAKNLPESFVLITDSSINVTVDEQDLKQDVVTKICEVVMRETSRTADKIIIQSCY